MDRTLKIIKPSGHKVAELVFSYDKARWASVRITEFRQLYDDDDPEDESKSVYEGMSDNEDFIYEQLDSIEKVQAFDRKFAKDKLERRMDLSFDKCKFEYHDHADPILLRYILSHPRAFVGLVNVRFSFADNTKQVAFESGKHPKFDTEFTTNALETNYSCLSRIMIFDEYVLPGCDVVKLDPWY